MSTARTPTRVRRVLAGGVSAVLGVAALCGAIITASTSASAESAVGLGTAESFAVLAGSGITNTGATTITGDVGSFPTTTQTGFGSVTLNGTNHFGDAVTQGAKTALITAYDEAAGRSPVTNVPVELGNTTLFSGVYGAPTFGLTGTLTLDAQGDPDAEFIFQAGSTLVTASDSRVVMLNGGDPCRVVWQVGSSATFGTRTSFVGDVLAMTSITANNAATFQGRLLARNGAVTMDNNTITNASCVTSSAPTTTTTVLGASTTTPTTPATTTTSTTVAPPTRGPTTSVPTTGVPATTVPSPAPAPVPAPGSGAASPSGALSPIPPSPRSATASPERPADAVAGAAPGLAQPPGSTFTPGLATTGSSLNTLVLSALGLLSLGWLALRAGRRHPGARS